jgi:hypothetical protein
VVWQIFQKHHGQLRPTLMRTLKLREILYNKRYKQI